MARHGYVPEYDDDDQRARDRGFMLEGNDRERFRQQPGHSAHPDAHYLSWRERHMQEVDRDYEEFRREREQQFHQDFGAWRDRKHGNPEPLRTGMTQTGLANEPTGTLELTQETAITGDAQPDPMATATLGTNSRGRRP
jgi:hypothetical protein